MSKGSRDTSHDPRFAGICPRQPRSYLAAIKCTEEGFFETAHRTPSHEPRRRRPRLHRRRPQVLDRQLDALSAAGCERVFEDHASGAAPDRPNLTACLDYLRRGDVLVVLDLDRLGRRAGELITLIDELDQRGVGFRALNSPMDTTTPAGRAFLQIQAAFAEMERNVIRQRVLPLPPCRRNAQRPGPAVARLMSPCWDREVERVRTGLAAAPP